MLFAGYMMRWNLERAYESILGEIGQRRIKLQT